MEYFWAVLILLCLITSFIGFIMLFIRGRRKKGALLLFGGFFASIFAALFMSFSVDFEEGASGTRSATDAPEETDGSSDAERQEGAKDATPEAHGYTVVRARDFSIPARERKGGQWYIASDATSEQDRAFTLIQAAKDLFGEMENPSHAFVWLFPSVEAAENGLANVGAVTYTPDGEGKESGFTKDVVWDVSVSDYQYSDIQKQIQELWITNRESYLDTDGFLNEYGLRAHISSKLGISESQLGKKLQPLYQLDLEPFEYDEAKDEYIILAGKSENSVANPDEFMIDFCRKELSCWAEKHIYAATTQCQKVIEGFAKYDFEWVDGFLGTKLTHYKWAGVEGEKQGIITYLGNEVKFQNGYGAWSPIIYECDFDPISDELLDVRIEEGRM